MKLFSQRTLIAAALATAFVGISATAIAQNASIPPELHAQHMAQRGTPGAGAMDPARMAERQKKMSERHAARMAQLKTELKISTAQEPAWNAFVARTAHEPRQPRAAEDWSQLTTPQRLDKMQALKAERDAEMSKRIDATKGLYAALTPEQQKVFDAQGHGRFQRAGMKGEHRMGGKGGHGGERGGHHGMGGGMGCESGPMQGGTPGARS
jgi:Spy/CpxP family protein refolding chaperone